MTNDTTNDHFLHFWKIYLENVSRYFDLPTACTEVLQFPMKYFVSSRLYFSFIFLRATQTGFPDKPLTTDYWSSLVAACLLPNGWCYSSSSGNIFSRTDILKLGRQRPGRSRSHQTNVWLVWSLHHSIGNAWTSRIFVKRPPVRLSTWGLSIIRDNCSCWL